jgi:subtilisin family serine protease
MDKDFAGSKFPDRDETKAGDGWVGASGTSSAAPQVAGVAALMLAKARAKGVNLSTADVRRLLQQTAVPVQAGQNAQGFPATGHPNIAVGHGLVNADAALQKI